MHDEALQLAVLIESLGFDAPIFNEHPETYIPKILVFARAMKRDHDRMVELEKIVSEIKTEFSLPDTVSPSSCEAGI